MQWIEIKEEETMMFSIEDDQSRAAKIRTSKQAMKENVWDK